MTIKEQYSSVFVNLIEENKAFVNRPIFVILGDTGSIGFSKQEEYVLDPNTFGLTCGQEVFDKQWFGRVFLSLMSASSYKIVSYQQYSYVVDYLNPDFFKDRVIVLVDNLRQIFPIAGNDFIADTSEDDTQNVVLPIYQADQFKIESRYYYSVKSPNRQIGHIVPVFSKTKKLKKNVATSIGVKFIDPYSDPTSIDIFIDDIIQNDKHNQSLFLKFYPKQPVTPDQENRILALNWFMSLSKGELIYAIENSISEDYSPSADLNKLLKRYWGDRASFRNIKIYKNPNVNNEIVEVSQGQVVQTLINEYENVRAGHEYRDVFLTAPTGAGKSLLFQLPAFYIASKGDVTIVVSPLIALMKDQVAAIICQRGFTHVAYINSEVSLLDRDHIIEKCKSGQIDILYMAPELLMSYDVRYFIGDRNIGLMVIDEAHLITTWGRDFRVDYWYIGNHINKIRKYSGQKFPMIAVTATAVYGGDKNDMVFDTIDSLMMHTPHLFIGMVKRNDIEFIINNYDSETRGFDTAKIKQTTEFIHNVNNLGFKTLVYAPYTDQVRKITDAVNDVEEIAVKYYGGQMDSLSKEQAEKAFRGNEKKVMVCTKAFGMGVDIPDIQVVYHHAPSGLLPDYVQEIGRAARDNDMTGYAVLNYSPRDQKYSKQLYGMSSLKLFQLKAVLKKVYDTYRNNGHKRNMLLSVDDFAFAFNDMDDMETKVKTALMMIEKDYLAKDRYNVLLARPKQLFTKVFASVSHSGYSKLMKLYPKSIMKLMERQTGDIIVQIDLNALWTDNFSDKSFPILKRDYYIGKLFNGIDVSPRIKVSYVIDSINDTNEKITNALDVIKAFLISQEFHFFEKDDMVAVLKKYYDDRTARQLASFVLASYSGRQTSFCGGIEENAFLQEKPTTPRQYKVFGNRYEGSFAHIIKLLTKLFESGNKEPLRFLSKENSLPYVRIGNLMEILNCGSFEMEGGESPMIFIRLNNPEKVHYDSQNPNYQNTLFEKTQEKHTVSTEIMNHFFTRSFSNKERWNFIEDFFLGENNEELIRKYPGQDINRIDVIEELSKKKVHVASNDISAGTDNAKMLYPPRPGKYTQKDHLTLEVEGKKVTHTIKEWILLDPITLHGAVKNKLIYVDSAFVYKPLMNALEKNFPEYHTKLLGTKKIITISGYKEPVMAEVVISENPIKFYKWWCTNRAEVYIPLAEKIKLFDRIKNTSPSTLQQKDLKFLMGGKNIS